MQVWYALTEMLLNIISNLAILKCFWLCPIDKSKYKYSPHYNRGTKQVVEMESEALKTKALLSKVAELERILGRKQLEIDFNNKVLELVSEELGYDVKKKYERRLSNGLDNIESNTTIG